MATNPNSLMHSIPIVVLKPRNPINSTFEMKPKKNLTLKNLDGDDPLPLGSDFELSKNPTTPELDDMLSFEIESHKTFIDCVQNAELITNSTEIVVDGGCYDQGGGVTNIVKDVGDSSRSSSFSFPVITLDVFKTMGLIEDNPNPPNSTDSAYSTMSRNSSMHCANSLFDYTDSADGWSSSTETVVSCMPTNWFSRATNWRSANRATGSSMMALSTYLMERFKGKGDAKGCGKLQEPEKQKTLGELLKEAVENDVKKNEDHVGEEANKMKKWFACCASLATLE